MPDKRTAAKAAAKGSATLVRNRTARRAVRPAAKATWFVGKKAAKRKATKQTRRYREAAGTARSAVLIYGPMVAEVFGLCERPKPRRQLPAFLAGVAAGGGLMYLAGRARAA